VAVVDGFGAVATTSSAADMVHLEDSLLTGGVVAALLLAECVVFDSVLGAVEVCCSTLAGAVAGGVLA
jgi:hypothetical protein